MRSDRAAAGEHVLEGLVVVPCRADERASVDVHPLTCACGLIESAVCKSHVHKVPLADLFSMRFYTIENTPQPPEVSEVHLADGGVAHLYPCLLEPIARTILPRCYQRMWIGDSVSRASSL